MAFALVTSLCASAESGPVRTDRSKRWANGWASGPGWNPCEAISELASPTPDVIWRAWRRSPDDVLRAPSVHRDRVQIGSYGTTRRKAKGAGDEGPVALRFTSDAGA